MALIKILIADDENDLRKLLQDQLVEAGYSVIEASDGKEAYEAFENENPDMAIIDIMMPFMDGLSLLAKIRENSDIPVILLTARGDEIDKVSGLRLGADDYIVKPWGMNELLARIEVQKRHLNIETAKQSVIVRGNLWMDFSNGVVKNNGEIINLNAKEYLILEFFARNMGKVLTKKQIYQEVWKEEYMYDDKVMKHLALELNSKEEIQKNEEAKRMLLVSEISHDLKNPLASVQGYSEMLYKGGVSVQTKQKEYAEMIHSNAVRANELLQSLFTYSKLGSAGYTPELKKIDICEYTRLIFAEYIPRLEDAGFQYELNIPDEEICVNLDQDLFRRVYDNLIENLMKYNHSGTGIKISMC